MKAVIIYVGVCLCCICSLPGVAQNISSLIPKKAKSINSFIPKGWIRIDEVYGDFNADGRKDAGLLLISKINEEHIGTVSRSFIILEATEAGYKVSATCDSLVLGSYCGGVHGDPYDGIYFSGNNLVVKHYGGSGRRWSYEHKFQLRNGKWVLIGQTTRAWWLMVNDKYHHNDKATYFYDINFMTGEYIEKKIDDAGRMEKDNKARKKIVPLVTLQHFSLSGH